jgi:hypothetical protein
LDELPDLHLFKQFMDVIYCGILTVQRFVKLVVERILETKQHDNDESLESARLQILGASVRRAL